MSLLSSILTFIRHDELASLKIPSQKIDNSWIREPYLYRISGKPIVFSVKAGEEASVDDLNHMANAAKLNQDVLQAFVGVMLGFRYSTEKLKRIASVVPDEYYDSCPGIGGPIHVGLAIHASSLVSEGQSNSLNMTGQTVQFDNGESADLVLLWRGRLPAKKQGCLFTLVSVQ